jgi:hypothetical protein
LPPSLVGTELVGVSENPGRKRAAEEKDGVEER